MHSSSGESEMKCFISSLTLFAFDLGSVMTRRGKSCMIQGCKVRKCRRRHNTIPLETAS